jgi:hypothetical protein
MKPSGNALVLLEACGWEPEAIVTRFRPGATISVPDAMQKGVESRIVPVETGHAESVYHDPALAEAVDAGTALILCFRTFADAREFQYLANSEGIG